MQFMIGALEDLSIRTVRNLAGGEDRPGDVSFADQRAKAICNLARAVKAIEALRVQPKEPATDTPSRVATARPINEDDMDEDDADSIDDAELERIRADLGRKLDRRRAQFETKRLAPHPVQARTVVGEPSNA